MIKNIVSDQNEEIIKTSGFFKKTDHLFDILQEEKIPLDMYVLPGITDDIHKWYMIYRKSEYKMIHKLSHCTDEKSLGAYAFYQLFYISQKEKDRQDIWCYVGNMMSNQIDYHGDVKRIVFNYILGLLHDESGFIKEKGWEIAAKVFEKEELQELLLKEGGGLDDKNRSVRRKGWEIAAKVFEKEELQELLLKEGGGLDDKNRSVIEKVWEISTEVFEKEELQELLLKEDKWLNDKNGSVKEKGWEIAAKVFEKEELQELLLKEGGGLNDENGSVKEKAWEIAAEVFEKEELQELLLKEGGGLNDENGSVIEKVWEISTEVFKKEKLQELLLKEGELYASLNTSLYEGYDNLKYDFQNKNNSDYSTLLMGKIAENNYQGKVIRRQMTLQSFLMWKYAYENYQHRQSLGFYYVPIEPILKYEFNDDGTVFVYSAVLDQNVGKLDFVHTNDRLWTGLESMNISFGPSAHKRNENICTLFERNKKGDIVFSLNPRQYIIDFDMSVPQF